MGLNTFKILLLYHQGTPSLLHSRYWGASLNAAKEKYLATVGNHAPIPWLSSLKSLGKPNELPQFQNIDIDNKK
jgi:hypothetical protein